MQTYPFQKRAEFLNAVMLSKNDIEFTTPIEERQRIYKNSNRASYLLERLRKFKLEWLKDNPQPTETKRCYSMDGLTWADVTSDGKYSLD